MRSAGVGGELAEGVTAKDLILYLIGQISMHGGTGYVLEYTGSAIQTPNPAQTTRRIAP